MTTSTQKSCARASLSPSRTFARTLTSRVRSSHNSSLEKPKLRMCLRHQVTLRCASQAPKPNKQTMRTRLKARLSSLLRTSGMRNCSPTTESSRFKKRDPTVARQLTSARHLINSWSQLTSFSLLRVVRGATQTWGRPWSSLKSKRTRSNSNLLSRKVTTMSLILARQKWSSSSSELDRS